MPPRTAAGGGRPQGGLEVVEKLLTTKLESADMTERNASMLRLTPRPVIVVELVTSSGCASPWSWSPPLTEAWPQLLGRDLDQARINALTRAAPGVFSMQHGLLPEEGSPRAFSPTALRRPASPACSSP
jgi:hypothetical protein